jgi:hypothetical protein
MKLSLIVSLMLLVMAVAGTAPSSAASPSPLKSVRGLNLRVPLRVGARVENLASALLHPSGRRMRSGGTTALSESPNWSGLAMTGSGFEGAAGDWTVPSIQSSGSALYSASWVGVDGDGNSDLIQTGTSQDTSDGYYAWWEILPATSVEITDSYGNPAPVEPGDQMVAWVAVTSTAGVWTIYLEDSTQGWYFEQDFDYGGPGQSAEWIEEAPTVGAAQSSPADFGTVDFSGTLVYGDFGSGTGWYYTEMDVTNEIAMINSDGSQILAMPSAPSAASTSGQSFSDTYVTPPSTPTGLAATPGASSAHLSWKAPTADGGTSIFGYYVREYLSGSLQRTTFVSTTSATVAGLTNGDTYSFSVAAHSAGNWTSPYSAAVTVIPEAPPRLTVSSPSQGYQISRKLVIRYSATDASSTIASFDVRYDVGPWNSAYMSYYEYPAGWQRTTATTEEMTGNPGSEYCFDVRARTKSGDVSAWSPNDCTTLPLGSGSLAAITPGWSRHVAAGYYLNSYVETTKLGAELRVVGAEAGQLVLIVTRCRSCGDMAVYLNGKLLKTVSTRGATTVHSSIIVLPSFSLRRATIVLKALSRGRLLILEGLGIS